MLTEYKLNPADFAGKNVSALPDRPGEAGMTAAQLKAAFDRSGEEVIASHINGLIDVLVGDTGADQIGTQSGDSVGKLLTKAVNSETIRHLKKDSKGALMISENGSTWTYASLDGHIVVDQEGAILPPRKHLIFMNSLAEDNSGRDATVIYGVKGDQGEKGRKRRPGRSGYCQWEKRSAYTVNVRRFVCGRGLCRLQAMRQISRIRTRLTQLRLR